MNFTNLKCFLDRMVETKRTPGCAVAVTLAGKLVYTYSAGVSDIDTANPMTGGEHFNIYSCSKIATVTAGAQLLEKGIIKLSDPLCEYIPEYRNMMVKNLVGDLVKAKRLITVGDLFTMSAGFNYDFNSPSLNKLREDTDNKSKSH